MACQLPEAISKIEEILSKNGEGVASAMLSGIQINMLNEAKNNLQSAIEIRMSRMQTTAPGSESIDNTKKDFRSEFKNKRPSAAKWADKEVAKFDVATQAISDGTNNSTAGFVKDFYGDNANTGTYTKDDVIYLSTNGNRTGRVIPVKNGALQGSYKNIDKAIEAGAKFVADTSKHLASTGKYNVGEVELAEYLQSKGYAIEDKDGYGLWSPNKLESQVDNKSLEPDVKYSSVVKTNLSSRQLELVENAVSKSKDIGMALVKISNSSEKDEYGRTFREMSIPAKEKLEEAIKIHEKFNKTQDKKVETNKESTLSEELEYLNNKNTFKGKATQKSQIIEYVLSSGDTSFGIVHKMLDGTMLVYDTESKIVNELSTGRFVNGSVKGILKKSFESAITVLKNLTDEKKEKLKKRLNEEGLKNKEINTFLKAGIDEKVRDIKISDEDLEILKKENEKLTKKTGVIIKLIENDVNADFNYNPDDNSVTYVEGFNDTITTVLQNHELKHALTFQYLKNNENDLKVAELIRGVSDFNDRLINLRAKESMNYKKDDSESYISKTNDLYERVDYMLKNSTDSKISNELRQVSEIVAILSAEKDIRDQFLNEFKSEEKSKLKRLLEWIKSKLSFKDVKVEYFFSPENIVKNVDEIVKQSSKEYKKNKEYAELSEPDVDPNNKYKIISKDDIEAAKDIMSNNKKECE